MNGEMKPTNLPDALRSALHDILEHLRHEEYLEHAMYSDLLDEALEVVRCLLVGIAAKAERETTKCNVRGEGWSL